MTEGTAPIGVLVMSYGTPRSRDDIEPYYTDIRRGRPPTPEALADLVARYDAIGGISPLARITESQRTRLADELERRAPGRYLVRSAFKHTAPKVADAAAELAASGVEGIVGIVLAPHYSAGSIGVYLSALRSGAAEGAAEVDVEAVESWATEPAYVGFLADELDRRLAAMRSTIGDRRVVVLFTAHSLPQRVLDGGDPYESQLRSTAEAVAARLGLTESEEWRIAWQSAGRTPEPWIGPDVLEEIDTLADEGVGGVIVCACGFVADHLEVLYDLDIEAAGRAAAHGVAFDRTSGVADDRAVMSALAQRIDDLAARWPTSVTGPRSSA
jgi:ferrochelatase